MKFGVALAHTKKKLEEAHSSIDNTEKRNRVLTKKLSDVEIVSALPALVVDGLDVSIDSEGSTAAEMTLEV
jgi:DNA recombination protein RmuC